MRKAVILLQLVITVSFIMAQMQPIGNSGNVDWESQVIISKGIGASNPKDPIAVQRAGALRVGKLDALRNALETFMGVQLNSETTVKNYVVENDVIQTQVEGFIKGFSVPEDGIHYMSDGSVEVEVKIPLAGILAAAPTLIFGGAPGYVCPLCGQPWPAGKPLPADAVKGPSLPTYKGSAGKVFTGLVIDARGLGLKPAMAPRIFDEDGKEIYGSAYVNKDWAVKQGMVGYCRDPKKAAQLDRVKDNPGMVKAVKALGKNKTDVMISNKDAADILNAKENLSFIEKCKVVFVVD